MRGDDDGSATGPRASTNVSFALQQRIAKDMRAASRNRRRTARHASSVSTAVSQQWALLLHPQHIQLCFDVSLPNGDASKPGTVATGSSGPFLVVSQLFQSVLAMWSKDRGVERPGSALYVHARRTGGGGRCLLRRQSHVVLHLPMLSHTGTTTWMVVLPSCCRPWLWLHSAMRSCAAHGACCPPIHCCWSSAGTHATPRIATPRLPMPSACSSPPSGASAHGARCGAAAAIDTHAPCP